jgi:hypothetical protein
MISAFGVDHGEFSKSTRLEFSDRELRRDLKNRQKFMDKYPKGGDGQMVRAKDLKKISDPANYTSKGHAKAVSSQIKQDGGQKRAVTVYVNRSNPNGTLLGDGHHRVHQGAGLFRNKKIKTNILNNHPDSNYQAWPDSDVDIPRVMKGSK